MKVERVLNEAQQRAKDEADRVEEARVLAEKGNNKRERALMDMMSGVLQVRREDLLKIVSEHLVEVKG